MGKPVRIAGSILCVAALCWGLVQAPFLHIHVEDHDHAAAALTHVHTHGVHTGTPALGRGRDRAAGDGVAYNRRASTPRARSPGLHSSTAPIPSRLAFP